MHMERGRLSRLEGRYDDPYLLILALGHPLHGFAQERRWRLRRALPLRNRGQRDDQCHDHETGPKQVTHFVSPFVQTCFMMYSATAAMPTNSPPIAMMKRSRSEEHT